MTGPVLAAAQCSAVAGDIAANAGRHLDFIDAAHRQGVNILVFPELSLTGYEPTLAGRLAQAADTDCIAPLRARARETAPCQVRSPPSPVSAPPRSRPAVGPSPSAAFRNQEATVARFPRADRATMSG